MAPDALPLGEAQADPRPTPDQAPRAQVELVLDSHCATGIIEHGPVPRRLVDILNGLATNFLVLHDAELRGLRFSEEEPQRSLVMHIQRDAILFAVPRAVPSPPASSFETVEKVAVPATLLLPGFQVSGSLYLPPDSDAFDVPLLASSRFIPLTDVTITPVEDGHRTWQEPIVVVNLARVLAYAPRSLPEACRRDPQTT